MRAVAARVRNAGAGVLLACAGLVAPSVHADDGPMGQGEAAIAVRSDVKLKLKGARGTPKARVEQLGKAVGRQMPDVRACYRKVVEKRPTEVGGFVVSIGLEKPKRADVAVAPRGAHDRELRRCITGVLEKARFPEVARPAFAVVELEFDNSRAAGQGEVSVRQAERAEVDVQVDDQGVARGGWASSDRRLAFRVESRGPDAEAGVAAAVQGLREGFAAFLDCRRRAEKGGLSPRGEVEVDLRMRRAGGTAKAKIKSITVEHKRVPNCIERAFRRTEFARIPRPARAQVTIEFR